jgi:iron complex transport system substrate-binding protein
MIRQATAAFLAAGLAFSGPAVAGKPQHIMSINLCTDDLLLDLVPPSRIVSITYTSRWPSNTFVWPVAAHLPINHGLAEEVLAGKPDLVLSGTFTRAGTRSLLRRLDTPLIEVAPAETFDAIRKSVRRVAHAVGEDARGEALLAQMDATVRALAADTPQRPIRVVAWEGDGSIPSRRSLFNTILTAAGGVNVAAGAGAMNGQYGIEDVLISRPEILLYGADSSTYPGLRRDADQHPLILKLYRDRRVTYPEALYSCGVPQSADAARALHDAMLKAMRSPAGAL